jgi:hypothetical protein
MYVYRLLTRILPTGKVFIKHSDLPICLHCLYFTRPTELQKEYRDDYELYGRCKKFGKMNLITGEIEYDIEYKMWISRKRIYREVEVEL